MKTKIITLMILAVFFLSGICFAGSYELIKGQDLEVCQVYEKYINSFDTDEPMICERPYNPEFPMIERPDWEEVDVNEHPDWLMGWYEVQKEIDLKKMTKKGTGERLQESTVETVRKEIEKLREQSENDQIKMFVSNIDIDNNGKKENILKIHLGSEAGGCNRTDMAFNSGIAIPATLLIINQKRKIDYKESLYKIHKAYKLIFIFRRKTYFDLWGGLSTYFGTEKYKTAMYEPGKGGGGVVIYKSDPMSGHKIVCEFAYKMEK
jgi:hypothetical protein